MTIGPTRFVSFLQAVLGASILFISISCTDGHRSGGRVTLRLAHNTPVGHPYDLAARRLADAVDSATNGEVQIKVYPASQLGNSSEQIEGLLLGTLDFSIAASSFASEFIPEFGIFSVPFLFDDTDHFEAVFDGAAGRMLDSLAMARYRIRLIGTLTSGDRSFFNSKGAIQNISDLQGLKVRVMSGKADALSWLAFGAIPTPMPYEEVYSALEAGVIDGAENDPASILSNRFYETCRFLALTNHLVLPMGVFASDLARQKVSGRNWEIILRELGSVSRWQRRYMDRKNTEAVDVMREQFGISVSQPDRRAFKEKVRGLQDEIASDLMAETVLEEIRKARRIMP